MDMNDEGEVARIPDAPWHLQGAACLSLWRLPRGELGMLAPHPDLPLLTLGESVVVVTIWAQYSGGTLRYDELAVAVLVRGRGLWLPAGSVTAIWVDDAVSAEGGRRLWHIPKALAEFDRFAVDKEFAGKMRIDGRQVAALRFQPGRSIPGRPGVSGFVIQPGRGGPLRTRCRVQGSLCMGTAEWVFDSTGPLAVLHGRKPLLSLGVHEMEASFGV